MLIQNATPNININIGQMPVRAGGVTPGLLYDNRHRPMLDQININIGSPRGPGQKLAGLLPEIQPANCRRTCRTNAQFGRGGPMKRLMRQFNKLMQKFSGAQGGQCCKRPKNLAQSPLASISIQAGGQGQGASPCGASAPQCMPPHQQQAQQLRQLLGMLFNLAQSMQGAQQCCPPPSCGPGAVPAGSIGCGSSRGSRGGGGRAVSSSPTRARSSNSNVSYRPPAPRKSTSTVSVKGGAGDDTIRVAGGGHTRIHGGAGDDRLTHKAGPASKTAVIRGGKGDDKIKVKGAKHTRIHGGKGDDKISYKPGPKSRTAVIRGGKGDDKIKATGAKHTRIHGGKGDDKISYKAGPASKTAVIRGGKGDDKIKVKGAKHTRIHGGKGDDKIVYSPTKNSKSAKIHGGKGNDTAVIRGDSSLRLADSEGNVFLKRGKGGPTVVLDSIEKVRLQGDDHSTTLRLANC